MRKITLYYNCNLLRNHSIVKETLWVQDGLIINPETVSYNFTNSVDCKGCIIAPGLIDLKVNGNNMVDFSSCSDITSGVDEVAKELVTRGVTAFCPTLVSCSSEYYRKALPKIVKREGTKEKGAAILGVHLDGPFISPKQMGAHLEQHLQSFNSGFEDIVRVYHNLDNVCIITLAPELPNAITVIKKLRESNVNVGVGHSVCTLAQAEEAVKAGASIVTHLFNGMPVFHHRDPSLVGLLASNYASNVFFSLIADGVHTHPAALKVAYRLKPQRIFLISDGIAEKKNTLGEVPITIHYKPNSSPYCTVKNTKTLCGGASTLDACVRSLKTHTDCPLVYALEAASLHPAMAVGISDNFGKLDFGYVANFILLDPCSLTIEATYIKGENVYEKQA